MSAIGPKQTRRKTQSVSLLGVKRTWLVAAHMSAFDPKRPFGGCPRSKRHCRVKAFPLRKTEIELMLSGWQISCRELQDSHPNSRMARESAHMDELCVRGKSD